MREFESIEDAITCAREFAQVGVNATIKKQDQSHEDKKRRRIGFLCEDGGREILIFISQKENNLFVAWLASKASKMCVPIEEVPTSSSSYQLWHYK